MILFDPTANFKRQFQATEKGFLYYPRAKSGGKLISNEEFDALVSRYRFWNGTRFRPGLLLGAMFAASLGLAVVAVTFELPETAISWSASFLAFGFISAEMWLWYTPYRLCRNRPDITPPRSRQDLKRAARAVLPWISMIWLVLSFGLISLVTVLNALNRPTFGTIAFASLSTIVFVQAVRIAIQKFHDN